MRRNPAQLLIASVAAALLLGGCASDPALDDPAVVDPALDDPALDDPAPGGPAGDLPLPPLHPEVDDMADAVVVLTTTAGEEVTVAVRVAASPAERRRGLMHVPDLPDGTGMLFVYTSERTGGFWMKDTLVPLDIAFVAPDGEVRAVLTMPTCAADPCPVNDPGVAYDRALEVPAGWFRTEGITPGATLETVTGGG